MARRLTKAAEMVGVNSSFDKYFAASDPPGTTRVATANPNDSYDGMKDSPAAGIKGVFHKDYRFLEDKDVGSGRWTVTKDGSDPDPSLIDRHGGGAKLVLNEPNLGTHTYLLESKQEIVRIQVGKAIWFETEIFLDLDDPAQIASVKFGFRKRNYDRASDDDAALYMVVTTSDPGSWGLNLWNIVGSSQNQIEHFDMDLFLPPEEGFDSTPLGEKGATRKITPSDGYIKYAISIHPLMIKGGRGYIESEIDFVMEVFIDDVNVSRHIAMTETRYDSLSDKLALDAVRANYVILPDSQDMTVFVEATNRKTTVQQRGEGYQDGDVNVDIGYIHLIADE